MKALQYKTSLIVLLFLSSILYAQKFDKAYTEEFNTNSDVIIDVNTRHTDIEIKTWNKNKVVVEAIMVIEGANKERADEIIKNWKFKALGNKKEVEIISKTSGLFTEKMVIANGVISDLENYNFDFVLPEISVENLAILDSLHVVVPDVLHFPEPPVIPDFNDFQFEFHIPDFDYEKYKDDKDYLKKWQEKMKKSLEKMFIEKRENEAKYEKNKAKLKEELKAAQEERKRAFENQRKELKKQHEERKKQIIEYEKARTEKRKEEAKLKHEILDKRKEELAKRRMEVKNILAERDKIKIKRTIRIKAPKDAKFNMNVSYGSMRFPD